MACGTSPPREGVNQAPQTQTDAPSYASFLDAIESGAPCSVLFDIRNEIRDLSSDSERDDRMNDDLRQIGCFSNSSERTDEGVGLTEEGFSADQYQLGYDIFAYDPQQVFAEAGTQDPEEAGLRCLHTAEVTDSIPSVQSSRTSVSTRVYGCQNGR